MHRLGHDSPELLRLYQQADLLVLPTHGDTNPWVLLEAMACGTPAVSSDVGAIPELLDEGRAGTVVPHGDVRALREAIDALLCDDSGARRSAVSCASEWSAATTRGSRGSRRAHARPALGVRPEQVVHAGDGCLAPDGLVWSSMVVGP